jgi:hypothetical protein
VKVYFFAEGITLRPAFFENLDYEPEGATNMGRRRETN